jgi:hypothetical protein
MRNCKRAAVLILALLMLVVTASCGTRTSNTNDGNGNGNSSVSSSPDNDLFADSGKPDEQTLTGRLFRSGDYIFSDNGDGTAYVVSYEGTASEVVFPSEVDGLNVTGIWTYSLYNSQSVRKVTLPASIEKTFYCALSSTSLTQIEVDAENPYLKSVEGVLYSKDGKTLICYPGANCAYKGERKFCLPDSVTSIDAGAFWYDSYLMVIEVGSGNKAFKDIDGILFSKDGKTLIWYPAGKPYTYYEIPESVTGIARYAFVTTENLEQIVIPAGVEKIAPNAFLGCKGLKWLTVDENNKHYCSDEQRIIYNKEKTELIAYPVSDSSTTFKFLDSLTKIGNYACFNCRFMYKAPVPAGVTEIGFDAFTHCKWLREVELPAGLKTVGENAFAECPDLRDIQFAGTMAEWESVVKGRNWNSGATPDITVHCSDGDVAISKD